MDENRSLRQKIGWYMMGFPNDHVKMFGLKGYLFSFGTYLYHGRAT